MKNSAKNLVAAVGILVISITTSVAQDGNVTNVNGNYKHQMPVTTEHTFASNFTKPEKESFNRNYKQQDQEKRNVKFRENFTKPAKVDTRNSKHPYGL